MYVYIGMSALKSGLVSLVSILKRILVWRPDLSNCINTCNNEQINNAAKCT